MRFLIFSAENSPRCEYANSDEQDCEMPVEACRRDGSLNSTTALICGRKALAKCGCGESWSRRKTRKTEKKRKNARLKMPSFRVAPVAAQRELFLFSRPQLGGWKVSRAAKAAAEPRSSMNIYSDYSQKLKALFTILPLM